MTAPEQIKTPQPEQVSVAKPSTTAEPVSSMSITASSKTDLELAQDVHVKGNLAYQRGDVEEAILHYQRALRLKPDLHDSRARLVAIFYAKQNINEANVLLQQAIKSYPEHTAYRLLAARIWQEQGVPERALQVLHEHTPTTRAKEYWQLQAALAQQAKQWQVALQSWQALLQNFNNDARWLLGSAIALDQLQRFEEARVYYLQAQQDGSLSQASLNFVAQRLAQLDGI